MIAELNNFIEQQEEIDNIILTGNLNEDINSNGIRKFFVDRGLFHIYEIINAADETK